MTKQNIIASTDDSTSRGITRRGFLGYAAGAVAGSVLPEAQGQSRSSINAYEALGKFSFITQQGKIISGREVRQLVGTNPFTISFGFDGCTNFCPTGNSVLGSLFRASSGTIKNVMINVNPAGDPAGDATKKEFRDSYMRSILRNKDGSATGANEANTIILYPLDSANRPSDNAAKEVSIALGNRTRAGKEYHSAVFGLYTPDGSYRSHVILTPNSDHKAVTDQFVSALRGQGVSR